MSSTSGLSSITPSALTKLIEAAVAPLFLPLTFGSRVLLEDHPRAAWAFEMLAEMRKDGRQIQEPCSMGALPQ